MRKFKKMAALLMAGMMILSANGCSGNGAGNDEEESAVTKEEGGNKLQLWHIQTAENRKKVIEEGVKEFSEKYGVEVEITVLENDPFKTKLRTAMGSGDAPDVFHSWGGGWLKAFADEGLVVDITEDIEVWKDQLNEAAIGMNTFDGKVYGSPYMTALTPLYYNKAIFEEHGLEVPTTWAEMETVCETLKKNGIIPFALANSTKWPGAQHFVMLSMRIGGADIFQKAISGEISFEDETFIKAGDMLRNMVDDGWFPEGANALNWDTGDSRQMFYAGQCAMILQTSGFISTCLSENEEFYNNNLALASYPAIEGGKGEITDMLAGENAFSVSADSDNVEMSIKLVEFLSTSKTVQQGFADAGAIGARTDLNVSTKPLQQGMDQLSNATYLQNFIDQTLSPELAEKHKDTCQALLGKTMTSEEAAKEMQKLYESIE